MRCDVSAHFLFDSLDQHLARSLAQYFIQGRAQWTPEVRQVAKQGFPIR